MPVNKIIYLRDREFVKSNISNKVLLYVKWNRLDFPGWIAQTSLASQSIKIKQCRTLIPLTLTKKGLCSWFWNPYSSRGESRLFSSAKLPHRPPTKIGNFLTSTRKIKIFRPNFERKKWLFYNKSPDVFAYINFNV